MEFHRNAGCLIEVIIAGILSIVLVYMLVFGNTQSKEMNAARLQDTTGPYKEYLKAHQAGRFRKEASDSIFSIVSRDNNLTIEQLSNVAAEYKYICSTTKDRLEKLAEDKTYKLYKEALALSTIEGWDYYMGMVPEVLWNDAKVQKAKLSPAYQKADKKNSIAGWVDFLRSALPDYQADAKTRLESLCDKEYDNAKAVGTVEAWRSYKRTVPSDYWKDADEQIEKAAIDYYRNYSLSTGAKPWAKFYGSGATGNSYVKVKTSSINDIVLIVKYNNANGRVANHAYIKKNSSYTLYLPSNQKYQVFFYMGTGWYPDKEMKDSIRGGFIKGSWDKDATPFYLGYGDGIEYTLTATTNGNFSASDSNQNEAL